MEVDRVLLEEVRDLMKRQVGLLEQARQRDEARAVRLQSSFALQVAQGRLYRRVTTIATVVLTLFLTYFLMAVRRG